MSAFSGAGADAWLSRDHATIREALDRGEVSSRALTEAALARAKSSADLNAFVALCDSSALAAADAADARLKNGERNAVLGLPIGLKDLIVTTDAPTTAASKMLEGFVSPYDAAVTTKLKRAGAPIIGKLNLDEFAMGSSNETSFHGAVKNPWDTSRVPGGSSGGSAAAVAARAVTLSLGTDTGGSIRQPSALCGVTGLKPTYGRVSRYGVVAFASSLDQVGPICADALGCAAVLETIGGYDAHDATSSRREVPAYFAEAREAARAQDLKGLRVGVPAEYFGEGLNPGVERHVRESLKQLEARGAKLVDVRLPHTQHALAVYYLVCTSEASSNLARYDGVHYGYRSKQARSLEDIYAMSRGEGFGAEVRLRVLLGTYALSSGYYDAYYRKASQVRALIRQDFEEAFRTCDVIAGPTSPTTAFRLGEKTNDPLSMYLADVYTLSANLAGVPALSMNVGFEANLPVGLQLTAPWWDESRLLNTAASYQAWHPDTVRGASR